MMYRLVGIVLVLSTSAYAQATRSLSGSVVFQGVSSPLSVLAVQPAPITQAESATALRTITLGRANAWPVDRGAPLANVAGPVRTRGGGFNVGGLPALDAAGSAGDAQYVQFAGGRLAVFDKFNGALQVGPVHASALFGGACAAQPGAAATVRYDHLARRWIVARSAGAYHCIAVSVSTDAAGSYRRYAMRLNTLAMQRVQAEDPRMAVWPDAYYFTFALFNGAGGAYRGPRACGIDRIALLAGRNALVRCHDFGPAYGPLSPSELDGYPTAPQGIGANTLLSLDFAADGSGRQLFMWRFSFSRNFLSAATPIPVAPFSIACAQALGGACVEQAIPGSPLAALGDRIAPRVAYRNMGGLESLVLNHSVQAGAQVGLRWYELRRAGGALQVYQHGTHAPDHNNRWMGSMAIDKAGNIALGYLAAGRDTPPGIRYTGRQRTDSHGRMQGEAFIVNGSGVQAGPAAPPSMHGAMSLDPVDGCTFWYTQQYAAHTGPAAWRTRIASFRFENCR